MKELEYPFNADYILKKSKRIRKELLAEENGGQKRIHKNIAVLGGSTTHDIIRILELFLLNYGIEPSFYESEYGQYYEDAMFPGNELENFKPDIIYIHTSNRNITGYPVMADTPEEIDAKLNQEFAHFSGMWESLRQKFDCPIIQNDFEQPFFRLLGNRDGVDVHGRLSFINRLNARFMEYAGSTKGLYINDINYIASCYGLDKWADPLYWHMYKYSLCVPAIPYLSYNIANIIKSIYGKNRKALVLDLDNTLWGGVIGDDGVSGIEIGQETNMGQVFSEFQDYVRMQKDIGVMLNVDSKNDEDNALAGLNHPDSRLHPDDFVYIKANWDPKDRNFASIAENMNILPESMVFVDDNPAEREIVRQSFSDVNAPDIDTPENYIRIIDHSGFFEVTELSEDDRHRSEMYQENKKRLEQQENFQDYGEYLKSLDMKAVIKPFEELYYPRIAQLTNKSNQFNLTTRRFSADDIERISKDPEYITLYGSLSDKFGDNGIVSLLAGKVDSKDSTVLDISLWLMSCRVLKRDMEFAMMDALEDAAKSRNISTIKGYYYPTAKNKMVKDFYARMGFDKLTENENGDSSWKLEIGMAGMDKGTSEEVYIKKNHYIQIIH